MNSILKRIERLEETIGKSQVNESFKSSALRQFILELRKLERNNYGFKSNYVPYELKDLNLSRLKEEDVIFIKPEQATKYLTTQYLICWAISRKKIVKQRSGTYSRRTGAFSDNNLYAYPGLVAITCGKKFAKLRDGNFIEIGDDNKWDKPFDGGLSFLKLRTEIADFAIVVDLEAATQSVKYTQGIRTGRNLATKGALVVALQKGLDVAAENIKRYKETVKRNKVDFETKEITDRVTTALTSLKAKINSIALTELISFSPRKGYTNDEVVDFAESKISKLKEFVNSFNTISYAANSFLEYANEYSLDHKFTVSRLSSLEDYLDRAGY